MKAALSRKEAAEILGVSERTVDNYLKSGMLTKYRGEKGRVVLLGAEVEELKEDRNQTVGPIMNRKTVADLLRRVTKLEREVRLLMGMHEGAPEPFRPSPEEALGLYQTAVLALRNPIGLEVVREWADALPKIDEETMKAVQQVTNTTMHGALFLQLCLELQRWLKRNPDYPTNLEMQHLHLRLEYTRQHLRSSLVLFVETYAATSIRELVQKIGGPDADTKSDILFRLRKTD